MTSEANVQHDVRLRAQELGYLLSRNNCGALKDRFGRLVKFGVFNPGGSDLIGWRSKIITQDMIGTVIAQFAACETKESDWTKPKDDHERKQLDFLELVRSAGGIGILAKSAEDVR